MMSSMLRFLFLLIGISIGVAAVLIPYINSIYNIERTVQIEVNSQIIVAKVVNTPEMREKGLSGRSNLGINEGMLFVFEIEGNYPFWMRGMKIPLDLVWIKGDRIVGITRDLRPESEVGIEGLERVYPPESIDRVLEINAGRADSLRAAVGDQIIIRAIVPNTDLQF